MIETTSSIREIIADTYIHCFVALLFMTLFFLLSFKNSITEVVDKYENVIDNIVNKSNFTKTTNYIENLNDLNESYLDKLYFPEDITRNLKISLITQLLVLFVSSIAVVYILDKPLKYWIKLSFNKLIFFTSLLCLHIIFYETIEITYTDVLKEDIYKILQKNLNIL